jgi:hypothetical protein
MPTRIRRRYLCDLCFADNIERDADGGVVHLQFGPKRFRAVLCAPHRGEIEAYVDRLIDAARRARQIVKISARPRSENWYDALDPQERMVLRQWARVPSGQVTDALVSDWVAAGRPAVKRQRRR